MLKFGKIWKKTFKMYVKKRMCGCENFCRCVFLCLKTYILHSDQKEKIICMNTRNNHH